MSVVIALRRRFTRPLCFALCCCAVLLANPAVGRTQESLSSLINTYVTKGRLLKGDLEKYQEVKTQLLKSMQEALAKAKTQTDLYAVTVLISELAEREYDKVGDKLINDEEKKITRGLTDNLLPLANDNDWKRRYVSLRTLGKITPDPEKAIPVIKASLGKQGGDSSELELRRVAAYALVDLARYAHLLPLSQAGKEVYIPLEDMKTIALVTQTARSGLADDDELVRGYSLLAVIESVNSLNARILPQQKPSSDLMQKKAKLEFEERGFDLTNKDFRDEFVRIMASFSAVNDLLLARLQDPSNKIEQTSLEAIEQLATVRMNFLLYLRSKSANPNEDAKKLFANIKVEDRLIEVKDPLQQVIVEDRGRSVMRMLNGHDDVKLRRKAMHVLEILSADLQLGEKGPQAAVLDRVAQVLSDPTEDAFIRWSAVNIIDKLVRSEQDPDKAKQVLQVILARDIDASLCQVLLSRDGEADPDLDKAAASALDGLGDLSQLAPSAGTEQKRLAGQYTMLVTRVFLADFDGRLVYDIGIRYDVETRKVVLKALISIGGEKVAGAVDIVIEALQKDPDPRIRRAAAEVLSKLGPAAEKALPALLQTLRSDSDSEVRTNASEAIVILTRMKKKS